MGMIKLSTHGLTQNRQVLHRRFSDRQDGDGRGWVQAVAGW